MNNPNEIIKIVIDELEKRNIIKPNLSTFKNTERLLFDYPKLKESIEERKNLISEYKKYGLPEKSKSITSIKENVLHQDKEDILANSITNLEKDIYKTEIVIKYIDRLLEKFQNDPYYVIINLYFFEHKTYEQIAYILDSKRKIVDKPIAISTIAANKNRIIKEMQKYFFTNDYIYQLFGY